MLVCHLYIFFDEHLRSLSHFKTTLLVFLLLGFKSYLSILDNSPWSCVFCKYFLPVCALSSHSFNIVFHRAEVFNFNQIRLSITYPRSSELSPLFFSGSFITWHFTFRSMIHFKLNFVNDVQCVSFLCMCMSSCFSTISWKYYLCSIVLPFLLC